MERRLILIINPDDLTNFEAVGLMEMVKLQLFAQLVNEGELD